MIVIVFGLPGSGKSYFARKFADLINADYISSDRVRKEMLNSTTYSGKEKLSVYDEMLMRMKRLIRENRSVVIDATFYLDKIRKKFSREESNIFFIEVKADEQVIIERLKRKRSDSNADFEVYKKIKQQWEPMCEPHLLLQSTDANIGDMLNKASVSFPLNHDQRTNK